MNRTELTQLLAEAKEARRNFDYFRAVALYSAILDSTEADTTDTAVKVIRQAALQEAGLVQRWLGNQDVTLACYEQLQQEADSGQEQVVALTLLGMQYGRMGEYEKALDLHQQARKLSDSLNFTKGRALTYQGIGAVLTFQGRYDEALSRFQKARSLFDQIGDIEELFRTWNWLGIVQARQGRVDKAIASFEKALYFARQSGVVQTAVALGNTGEAYQQLFAMEQALTYHEEALALLQKAELPPQEIDARRNMGVELCYLGQPEKGITYLEDALFTSRMYSEQDLELQSLYSLALVELDMGQTDRAAKHARALQEIAQTRKMRGYQAQALHLAGLCRQAAGERIEAEQVWQQALFLAHETGQQSLLWQLHAALAAVSENPALAATHNQIAAEVIDQIVYPIEDEVLRQTFLNAPPVKAVLRQVGG